MQIKNLIEAGTPNYNFDASLPPSPDRRTLTDAINKAGGSTALEQVLQDNSKMIFRGIRNQSSAFFVQNTWTTERRSENTTNYVTALTTILPSWAKSGIPPRSKAVSCSSNKMKASGYGTQYVVLPTSDSVCVYVGTDDFWNGFDLLNHAFGTDDSIPAINDAFQKYAMYHAFPLTGTPDIIKSIAADIQDKLDGGVEIKEFNNEELQAILEVEPGEHNILKILDNMLDPSHMRVAKGGMLLTPTNPRHLGEEIAVSGKMIYVEYSTFQQAFL